jgi:hypothetical protein
MTRTLLIVLFVVSPIAIAADNPYSFWCDYHSERFTKTDREYPSGKCYDVYTHTYTENGRRLTHKAVLPCDR